MTTLTAAFAQAASDYRDRVALIDGDGRSYRFSQVQGLAESYAAGWHAKGVRAGDRVLIAMGIGVELYASLAALWSLGATVVLPEPAMGLAGVKHAVATTNPKYFCATGAYRFVKWLVPGLWRAALLCPERGTHSQPPPSVATPEGIALISFTSGTTGAPKAIPRSHAFLMAQWRAVSPLLASNRAEVDLVTFPVFVLINLAEGRTSVLPNWKMSKMASLAPEDLVAWIAVNRCSRALLPPALCEKLCDARDIATLDHIFTGGGPVFADVITRLHALSEDIEITTVYGSTEAEPIAHAHNAKETGYGLMVGQPVATVQLRIVDSEIQVAGAHVNAGYLDPAQDAETKVKEGDVIWHRTGDAGRMDDQGRLWLLGRVGEDVQTDQGPLYPFAIEAAARMWPGVKRAALLAQDGGAILVVQGDVQHLEAWQDLAAEQGVGRIVHVDVLPLDKRHQSKVDRTALRALLQQKLA